MINPIYRRPTISSRESRSHAAERSLHAAQQLRFRRAVIAVQHVTVVSVDHDWYPREPRGHAAQEAGLGGVRVDNVRALHPHQPVERQDRGHISQP